MLKFLFLTFFVQRLVAHPDRLVKYQVQKRSSLIKDDLPEILSYHIHCLFVNNDSNKVKKAMMLYYEFQNQFNLTSSPDCQNLFDEKRLCMFEFEPIPGIHTPFVAGNWAVFVPLSWFSSSIEWILQHRGDLDILIHPNSGAEVSDHGKWALWGGNIWPINFSILKNQTLI